MSGDEQNPPAPKNREGASAASPPVRMSIIVLALLALLLGPMLFVAGCGRSFVFHPTDTSDRRLKVIAGHDGWQRVKAPLTPSIDAVGLLRPPTRDAGLWVFAFGGNAMDLGTTRWILDDVRGTSDVGALTFAYRGYDGTGGQPSQDALLADAQTLAAWLQKERGVTPDRLVLLGVSLGTGVASQLAAALCENETPPAGLVLVSPFTSVAAIFDENVPLLPVGWAVRDPFRTDAVIGSVSSPVLIVHGVEDPLIPIEHGRALKELLGDTATLVELDGRAHNDVFDDVRAASRIRSFIADRHHILVE